MKKWVQALRSGKFKQGKSTLKQFNKKGEPRHCCLGVLCELYNQDMKKNHKKSLPVKNVKSFYDFEYGYAKFGNSSEILPNVVKKWAGMKSAEGSFTNEDSISDSLVDMNDTGKTFKSISNTIEERWEIL